MSDYCLLCYQGIKERSQEEWLEFSEHAGQRLATFPNLYQGFREPAFGVDEVQELVRRSGENSFSERKKPSYFLTGTTILLDELSLPKGRYTYQIRFSHYTSKLGFSEVRDFSFNYIAKKKEETFLQRFKSALKFNRNYEFFIQGLFGIEANPQVIHSLLSQRNLFGELSLKLRFNYVDVIRPRITSLEGVGVYYYDPKDKRYCLGFIPDAIEGQALVWQRAARYGYEDQVRWAVDFLMQLKKEHPPSSAWDNLIGVLCACYPSKEVRALLDDDNPLLHSDEEKVPILEEMVGERSRNTSPIPRDISHILDLDETTGQENLAENTERDLVNGPKNDRFKLLDLD